MWKWQRIHSDIFAMFITNLFIVCDIAGDLFVCNSQAIDNWVLMVENGDQDIENHKIWGYGVLSSWERQTAKR